MLKRMSLGEKFIAFVAVRNPNEWYDWSSRCDCPCAQFLKERGHSEEAIMNASYLIEHGVPPNLLGVADEIIETWLAFNRIARGESGNSKNWTFGKLHERLLAEYAEAVA